MKLMVLLELEVSATVAETMQRNGFVVAPDGTELQVKVANCPTIPRRKINIAFIENSTKGLPKLIEECQKTADSSTT